MVVGLVVWVTPVPASASARPGVPASTSGLAGWRLIGQYTQNSALAGEGVATLTRGGHQSEIYRGVGTIPSSVRAEGWTHIGDPDSYRGYVIDNFQGSGSGHTKMFMVTTPSGKTYQYVHTLVPHELYNNSFDTISPDGRWMVAGTWTGQRTLQIYPAPLLNPRTPPKGGALGLAGYIDLDHEVFDVQGCDFVSATELICSSTGDPQVFTNPEPVLAIDLSAPLDGHSVRGHVVDLGSIPEHYLCPGTGESEGVDYDVTTRILRIEIIQPGSCILHTTVYEYKRDASGH